MAKKMEKVEKSDVQWREQLSADQYRVTRRKGTEQAFTGEYHDSKQPGSYRCVCCDLPLFSSQTKYDSGSGWPSYWELIDEANVVTKEDSSLLFMSRTEVLCVRCDAHLGHVFDDGPEPTGLRYCINSAALRLDPE